METSRFEFKKGRYERVEDRLQKDQGKNLKRFDLVEKILGIEQQPVELEKEERKSSIAVLTSLVTKLD